MYYEAIIKRTEISDNALNLYRGLTGKATTNITTGVVIMTKVVSEI